MVFLQTFYLTRGDAGLVLAHGVEREVVDVPVVLVPRLEEGDHAVEQQEEEEDQNESLFVTNGHLFGQKFHQSNLIFYSPLSYWTRRCSR